MLILTIGFSIYISTLPSSFKVEKSLLINAPSELIYNEVNDYTTWKDWNPWVSQKEGIIISYTEKTTGKDAGYTLSGNQENKRLVTQSVIPQKSIQQELSVHNPFGTTDKNVYWTFEKTKEGTKVTWGLKGTLSFWGKVNQLTQDTQNDKQLKNALHLGLKNLAQRIQKIMAQYSVQVSGVTLHSGSYYMYKSTVVRHNPAALINKRDQMVPEIRLYMQQNNIPIQGNPLLVFNTIDSQNGTAIISVGIPTADRVITPNEVDIVSGFMAKQKTVKVMLKGNTKHLTEAWKTGKAYCSTNDLQLDTQANMLIVFTKTKEDTKNPAEWITTLYLPIQ